MRDALGRPSSILLLGGDSDIGVAIARRLAAPRCAKVVLAGRSQERMEARRAELPGPVELVAFDAEAGDHSRWVEEVLPGEDVDVVVAAFGLLGDQAAAEQDAAAALAVGRVNYLGLMSVLIPLSARLRAQGHGAIVVLSSVAAERPRRANFVYGSAKAGADAFAQGLADAHAGTGVQVMVVRPGFVRSKMTQGLDPAPFSTTPEAVAEVVEAGLRRGAHTVWAPPLLRHVMAVLRHLPRPLFRRLKA